MYDVACFFKVVFTLLRVLDCKVCDGVIQHSLGLWRFTISDEIGVFAYGSSEILEVGQEKERRIILFLNIFFTLVWWNILPGTISQLPECKLFLISFFLPNERNVVGYFSKLPRATVIRSSFPVPIRFEFYLKTISVETSLSFRSECNSTIAKRIHYA